MIGDDTLFRCLETINEINEGKMAGQSMDGFKEILDQRIAGLSVNDMRSLGKSSAATSRKMGKSDERLAFHQTLQLCLSSEERARPIEEQFPFVRADLDQLSTNTIKLEASVESLCNKSRNTAIEMEAAVCALFDVWLDEKAPEFGDHWRIVLPDGKIFSGKNVCLVQWDGIFGTSKYGEVRLILIETKEIPHSNDLIIEGADGAQNGKTLYGRGKKTVQYLRDLCDESKPRSNYGPMRTQENVLRDFVGARLTVCYASGLMRDDIKDSLRQLQARFDDEQLPIDVWAMECPRLSSCNVASFTSAKVGVMSEKECDFGVASSCK
jgi:hypothetical protein